jgi:hypothetical protein
MSEVERSTADKARTVAELPTHGRDARDKPVPKLAAGTQAWEAALMGKRPSFIEVATDRLSFLPDDHGFAGPEIERPGDRIPAIAHVRYHRSDVTIEVTHVVGFMGENYVETRCRRKDGNGEGSWAALGSNATHTGYQLRRALGLQVQAIRSRLGLS